MDWFMGLTLLMRAEREDEEAEEKKQGNRRGKSLMWSYSMSRVLWV
jgi:hypothetical protein